MSSAAGDPLRHAAILVLLGEAGWRRLEEQIERAMRDGSGDAGVLGHIDALHLAGGRRTLMRTAYAIWRGFGPALRVDELWGLDRNEARRLLAALAEVVAPGEAVELLEGARTLVE